MVTAAALSRHQLVWAIVLVVANSLRITGGDDVSGYRLQSILWRLCQFIFVILVLGIGVLVVWAVFYYSEKIGTAECVPKELKPPSGGCEPKDVAKTIADVRSSLLQVIAGLAGALAVYFTWRNYNLGREGRTSDNFIKAVDQLGNEEVTVRVGGIFGLGRLLRTAKPDGDYWPIMDVLTAFTRSSFPAEKEPRAGRRPQDLQAAIDVLARRSGSYQHRTGDSPVDLHDTDLSDTWLASQGHFEDALLEGCYLVEADLRGSYFQNATFTKAVLTGASLHNANFSGADFSGADLGTASGLGPGQLNLATGDAETRLPLGYPRPRSWTAYRPPVLNAGLVKSKGGVPVASFIIGVLLGWVWNKR
jgi:Pentapeptide repeats (8 copies)